ncbi:hypothetical protein F528_0364 [Neisseria meningitidis 992008]|nr:hypothetical protein F528_0364 [Neisseria meningitidis 992008]
MLQEFIGDGRGLKVWIPACAGMTVSGKSPETRNRTETGQVGFPRGREGRNFRLLFLIFCFVGITGFWMMCTYREN